MAINQSNGVFPPRAQGGTPNSHNICNGYEPINAVVGDGPLYVSPDCTTTLTDCQTNAWTSELFSAVDLLGYSYNTGRITNLGEALVHRLDILQADIDTRVRRAGDAMTGPLDVVCPPANDNNAACKVYVDQTAQAAADACCTHMQSQLDTVETALQTDINTRVRRDGDQMTGPLLLSRDPVNPNEAATKNYIDINGGRIIIAPDAPSSHSTQPNRLWWSSTNGRLYVHFDDGTSLQWVEVSGTPIEGGGGSGVVPGGGVFLPLAGGWMTGPLFLHSSTPTLPMEAATKEYVDSVLSAGGTFIDAPADNELYARKNNLWEIIPEAGATIHAGPTPPSDPQENALWYDSTRDAIFLWYDSGLTPPSWISVSGPAGPMGNPGAPGLQGPPGPPGPSGGISEAPDDGEVYGRQNMDWVAISIGMDGGTY